MGTLREHMDHHDDPEALSLLTESARVVDVSALDHNRTSEVRRATASVLEDLGRPDLVTDEDTPHVQWKAVTELLDDAADRPLVEKLDYLSDRYHRPFPSVLSIHLREDVEPIDFVPGQYLTIRFHDTPRPYSVASSPNGEELAFCIRRVPGGRLTTDLFERLDPGDEVTVRGPNGDFVMADPSPRDVAFLATGTGVAPLRSMIKYLFEEGEDVHVGERRDVWLFLGCSWKDDLPYREEFRTLARALENFHFVPTLSRESYISNWQGETAYVQQTFVKYLEDDVDADLAEPLSTFRDESPNTDVEARIDPTNLEVYACGVSAMVRELVDAACQVGVPEEHVQGEGYG